MYIFVFFLSLSLLSLSIAIRHSQSGLKEVTDDWAERVFLIESVSLNVMSGNVPLFGTGNYGEAVTLAAASPAHFTHSQPQPLCSSPEIILSRQCVWLLTVNEVCSAVLLTGSSSRPDWCLGSKACSHVSGSAHTTTVLHQQHLTGSPLSLSPCLLLTTLLSVSCCGPDVCIVYILLLPITRLFTPVQMTIDRWQADAQRHTFSRFYPKHKCHCFAE